ncbi:MAG: hybrid sensor histidine kinase/response regulator [Sulfurimonas sp.]|jgi:DNA-binding response OmpR family regulator
MKQTILIVDDAKENINLLVQLLKKFDLIAALDGQTAIDIALREENIDLILLDIMMPDIDGFEVCKVLKRNPKTANIPIIFLSAKNKNEDIEKGFELGGVDYVTKPFNPNELLSRVATHLELRSYQKNLEARVFQEIQKNLQKEQMIHQQSKQAALGELLMHIAHQWKQPLSSLGSINLLNKARIETGNLPTLEELTRSVEKSEDLIMFMSDTINTFKNFYKPSNTNEHYFISECVLDILSIVEATFYFDNIQIYITSIEEEKSYGNVNEFSQVIFSILSNARDIFKERNRKKPEIHIRIENKKISIRDNGGGIDAVLLDKLFTPYISSHNSTGIGLYLSKNIVEKNNGIITAQNKNDGAIFTIEFITWMD